MPVPTCTPTRSTSPSRRHAARDLIAVDPGRSARRAAPRHVCPPSCSTPSAATSLLDMPSLDDLGPTAPLVRRRALCPGTTYPSQPRPVRSGFRRAGATWPPMRGTLGPHRRARWTTSASSRDDPRHHSTWAWARTGHRVAVPEPPAAGRPRRRGRDLGLAPSRRRIASTLTLCKLNESRPHRCCSSGRGESPSGWRRVKWPGPDPPYPASLLDRHQVVVMADNAALPADGRRIWPRPPTPETDWAKAGKHTGRTDVPASTPPARARRRAARAGLAARRFAAVVSSARVSRARRDRAIRRLGDQAQAAHGGDPSSVTTNGAYRGLARRRSASSARTGNLWRAACRTARRPDAVGATPDRAIAPGARGRRRRRAVRPRPQSLRVVGARLGAGAGGVRRPLGAEQPGAL